MILVTGFEPYAGSHVNPSALVLASLPDVIKGRVLRKAILPCDSQQTPSQAMKLASEPAVRTIVILGEDSRYALLTLERVAYNWLQYDVPDNHGYQPMYTRIIEKGPNLLVTQLDTKAIQLALAARKTEINVASDPGRHLCNHVYYTILYYTKSIWMVPKTVILLHLPRLPEQQMCPSLPFDESFRSTREVIEYITLMGW